MINQLNNSILIGDGEIRVVRASLVAPLGEPAVAIVGNGALLRVTAAGSITAPDAGNTAIEVSGQEVALVNSGEITGAFNGIFATGDNFTLLNRGTIASDSRAIDLNDGDGSLVINSGLILGTGNQRNGTLYVNGLVDDLTVVNTGRGTIDAGVGNLGDGISIEVGDASEDPLSANIEILNRGTIQGRGTGSEVFANGARVTANGSSGIRFVNGAGLPASTLTGSIENFGTITAEITLGFLGAIVVEDGVGFEGSIINRSGGLISAPQNGIYIGNGNHDLVIENAGRIESNSRAINLDGNNISLINTGEIIGTGNQRNGTIYFDGTADEIQITNESSGVIDAGVGNSGSGISIEIGTPNEDALTNNILIENNGLVQGRGTGNVPAGIRLFLDAGLTAATFVGDIINQENGVINSETQAGILIEAGVIFEGQIVNDGAIAGGNGFAIDAAGALGSVDLVNNGILTGDVRLGNGNDRFVQNAAAGVVVDGGAGDDFLTGGAGDDVLIGGFGNDALTGGLGADTFRFQSDNGFDVVTDFAIAEDVLDVSAFFTDISQILGVGGGCNSSRNCHCH